VCLGERGRRERFGPRRAEEEEELKLEKEQIERGIKDSAGSVREQWKYRLAAWREKMAAARKTKLPRRRWSLEGLICYQMECKFNFPRRQRFRLNV
jgi:hypothetical protein